MAQATPNAPAMSQADAGGRYGELRQRLLFLFGALVVYRIGTFIPVPGIDPVQLAQLFEQQGSGSMLNLFNMFSGGALERLSILALGIMPYISTSHHPADDDGGASEHAGDQEGRRGRAGARSRSTPATAPSCSRSSSRVGAALALAEPERGASRRARASCSRRRSRSRPARCS